MNEKTPPKTAKIAPEKPLGTGLQPTPKDERDFRLGAVYGTIDIKTVPMGNFNLPKPLVIKNQGPLDFCPTYMATAMSEDQEGIPLAAKWQFSQMKEILGEWETWGGDLRSALLSMVKVGSIPETMETDFLKRQGHFAEDRDFLANWKNWPESFKKFAKEHRKQSLFTITVGKYDAFDTVRAALWQHKANKCSVALGVMWRYNWNNAENGIIPHEAIGAGEGHALKAFDQVVIGGEQYIAIQNSWGDTVGDHGIFYANREVFNSFFAQYGFFMVKDIPVKVAKYLLEKNLTISSAWWVKILVYVRDLFTRSQQ